MAEAGEDVMPALGGKALSEDHAALWLAVLELLAQLQRKTGAGRAELLRAIGAAMMEAETERTSHDNAAGARKVISKIHRAGPSFGPTLLL